MMLEFPEDPACDYLDRQYMLGDDVLVAPVFSEHGDVDFYVPEGRWTHLLYNDVIDGSRWHRQKHGFNSIPLYVRPNTLLALGSNRQKPDYDYSQRPEFHLFELDEGVTVESHLTDLQGNIVFTLTAIRSSNVITVTPKGKASHWTLCLRNRDKVAELFKGSQAKHSCGILITPDSDTAELMIKL